MEFPYTLQQAVQQISSGGGAKLVLDADSSIPTVICRLPLSRQAAMQSSALITMPMFYNYESEGPIVRFLVRVINIPADSYQIEMLIDPTDKIHRKILESLVYTTFIRFHIFGTEPLIPHLATSQFRWVSLQRVQAKWIMRETEEKHTNFDAARQRLARENPNGDVGEDTISIIITQ